MHPVGPTGLLSLKIILSLFHWEISRRAYTIVGYP